MFVFLTSNSYFGISLAHWLVVLSAALSLSGAFAYIRDMFRGKSKPNIVTWGLWAFTPLIASVAALSANADGWATVRIFMSGFGPLLVFLFAFIIRQSYWKLSKLDYACGALSVIALFVWLGADSPLLAILLLAGGDLLATFPTIIKAWKHPETETLYTYFVGLFTATIVIPAIPVWNIENSAFQIYLLVANTSLFLIVLRGYFLKRKATKKMHSKDEKILIIAIQKIWPFILGTLSFFFIAYLANTGKYFGKFINKFSPCTQVGEPITSFPCYGIYDISIMIISLLIAIFIIVKIFLVLKQIRKN